MTEQNNSENTLSQHKVLAKNGVLKVNITDKKMLYACYMPFVKGCGIFIYGEADYQLDDEVFLLLKLFSDDQQYAVSARVVWLNAKQKIGNRLPGIGLQILDKDADGIKQKIESILGKSVNSSLPTATM